MIVKKLNKQSWAECKWKYFSISTVVELRLGDALTSINHGFRLLSMMMSYP